MKRYFWAHTWKWWRWKTNSTRCWSTFAYKLLQTRLIPFEWELMRYSKHSWRSWASFCLCKWRSRRWRRETINRWLPTTNDSRMEKGTERTKESKWVNHVSHLADIGVNWYRLSWCTVLLWMVLNCIWSYITLSHVARYFW